jgi:hypothetical protein
MKNNFDDRLIHILVNGYDAYGEPFDVRILLIKIKAEIAAHLPDPEELVIVTDYNRMDKRAYGYNQALQEVKEALQLEGKKE